MPIDNFPAFAKLVADSFQNMVKTPQVYVTAVEGDALYAAYLKAFPAGTNPIFKKQTEHDCSCCKQFIRRAGNIVTVDANGIRHTVWEEAAKIAARPYDYVAEVLHDAVLACDISDLYRVSLKENSFGAQKSRSMDGVRVATWDHFFTGPIPKALQVESPGQVCGDYRTTVQVFERGLTELSVSAVETVLSLIESNNLYRGAEHKAAVVQFQKAQKSFSAVHGRHRKLFVWANATGPAARFRNTVIGTLVQDISEGVDVERAVASFETKVAPTNYKRTTAVITPAMVKKAMETIAALDLEPALERRFARIEDVSVNDVLWVDGGVRSLMKGGLTDKLLQHAAAAAPVAAKKDEDRAEAIALDAFMKDVLPVATGMELFVKSEQLGNLVSLTAPVHPEPKQLFKWNNDFAWSYGGNVADSIKERVKKAGGRVEGCTMRVSLSWFNFDDLDLHIYEPKGRGVRGLSEHIFFGSKVGHSGGTLDVDMNAGGPRSREAVENVVWPGTMATGAYKVVVSNYASREMSNVGFVIEVENAGKLSHFSYNKALRSGENIEVCTLHVKEGVIQSMDLGHAGVTASNVSQTKWGLTTEQYVKVNAVTLSPNFWGSNAVGNKHTIFVLDGAKSDEATRGIYNEFLHPRLEAHRKVFEVIGDKAKCQPTDNQLSGLGFSSTKRDSFLVKVQQGRRQRLFNVTVGA